MDTTTRQLFAGLRSEEADVRYAAFCDIIKLTDKRVDWAYEVWDELLRNLGHANNHMRAQATQMLCNLAKSDPENRMLVDFDKVMAVTRDARFVTARHTLQAVWKVGEAGERQRALVLDQLTRRFDECATEKNCTLIRYDILAGLRTLYDATHDESIKARALQLIECEADPKYRKKYTTLWKH